METKDGVTGACVVVFASSSMVIVMVMVLSAVLGIGYWVLGIGSLYYITA